jgi:hypothetical protein
MTAGLHVHGKGHDPLEALGASDEHAHATME